MIKLNFDKYLETEKGEKKFEGKEDFSFVSIVASILSTAKNIKAIKVYETIIDLSKNRSLTLDLTDYDALIAAIENYPHNPNIPEQWNGFVRGQILVDLKTQKEASDKAEKEAKLSKETEAKK